MTFDGSTSSDPDGTIVKYEWDLDGNGTLRAQLRKQPARHARLLDRRPGRVHLRVTDNLTGNRHGDRHAERRRPGPDRSFTVSPNPAVVDLPTTFNGSASSDRTGRS